MSGPATVICAAVIVVAGGRATLAAGYCLPGSAARDRRHGGDRELLTPLQAMSTFGREKDGERDE